MRARARLVTPGTLTRSMNPELGPEGGSAVASALPALTALTELDIRSVSAERRQGEGCSGMGCGCLGGREQGGQYGQNGWGNRERWGHEKDLWVLGGVCVWVFGYYIDHFRVVIQVWM